MSDKTAVPNFLTKLFCMLNDPSTDRLISWGKHGDSFQVLSQEGFSKEVLPLFFKHSNFASFVRQLNMYGFHKVPQPAQGALLSGFDEIYEFSNPNFKRGHPELLSLVVRKKSQGAENISVDLNHLIQQIVAIKRTQSNISNDLKNIKNDNQSLWNESLALRERYARQQETIDKILGFLASIFSSKKPILNSLGDGNSGDKRKLVEVEHDLPQTKRSKVGDELVTTYLQNLVQNPSQESDLSSQVGNVVKETNKVEKHLDLLQDHVIDVASLVGIDPDNFMNFHGTDEDRETLLSIMNNNEQCSMESLDEMPFSVLDSTGKYDTFLGDLGDDPLQEPLE